MSLHQLKPNVVENLKPNISKKSIGGLFEAIA